METLVTALGPMMVDAFAVQQLLELADPVFFKQEEASNGEKKKKKK